MKLRNALIAAFTGVCVATPVLADLVFPALTYRTGAYAVSGIPQADGYSDYFTMLNQRDGGIGGVPIKGS